MKTGRREDVGVLSQKIANVAMRRRNVAMRRRNGAVAMAKNDGDDENSGDDEGGDDEDGRWRGRAMARADTNRE